MSRLGDASKSDACAPAEATETSRKRSPPPSPPAAYDYLYREELEAMQADGSLTRLDLAFSRDQDAKVYVQHRMLENAAELYRWLEEGAHFYVCGDASRMAKDVDAALHKVVERRRNATSATWIEGCPLIDPSKGGRCSRLSGSSEIWKWGVPFVGLHERSKVFPVVTARKS